MVYQNIIILCQNNIILLWMYRILSDLYKPLFFLQFLRLPPLPPWFAFLPSENNFKTGSVNFLDLKQSAPKKDNLGIQGVKLLLNKVSN